VSGLQFLISFYSPGSISGQDIGIQIFKNPLLMGILILNDELSAGDIIGETS